MYMYVYGAARRYKPHSAGDTSLEYYARGLRVLHGAHRVPNEPDAINPLLALAGWLRLLCARRTCVYKPPLPTIARHGIAAGLGY